MTRRRTFLWIASALVLAAIGVVTLDSESGSPPSRSTARSASIEVATASRGHEVDASLPLSRQPPSVRAERWLAAHPPRPEVHAALLDIAARADEIAQPLPTTAPESDPDAEAVLAARRERHELQTEFRAKLRDTLRRMTREERAAMRAAHVNVIQLARHVAQRANG